MPFNLSNISQNLLDYLPEQPLLLEHISQKNLLINYLSRYFSPWTSESAESSHADIKPILLEVIEYHQNHPGYALTRKKHEPSWIQHIIDNADLSSFPNISQPGIVLSHVESRLLPTSTPSFKDINSQWHAYPFDDMQQSYLTAGTPVEILHISRIS